MTAPAKHISISIDRTPEDVYQYATNPDNLQAWAHGIGKKAKIRFLQKNNLGVMDHFLTVPTGETIYIPFRVVPNREGSEVIFTILKHPGFSDEDILKDSIKVSEDLTRLKNILESMQLHGVDAHH